LFKETGKLPPRTQRTPRKRSLNHGGHGERLLFLLPVPPVFPVVNIVILMFFESFVAK
jgi:hypothetical protein